MGVGPGAQPVITIEAATVVADRAAELLDLVRPRDAGAFDTARAAYRPDPLGTGGRSLGELDAAAAACWTEDSAVPPALAAIEDAVADLEAALDPPDLRAPGD